jgi:hypothetical protein
MWNTLGTTVQKVDEVAALMRTGDPFLMYCAIFKEVNPATAVARYTTIFNLLGIEWKDGWTLKDAYNAVSRALNKYTALMTPDMTPHDCIHEIAFYALVRALPPEYGQWSSSALVHLNDKAMRLKRLLPAIEVEDGAQNVCGRLYDAAFRARLASTNAPQTQPAATSTTSALAHSIERQALAAVQKSRPNWRTCWLCRGDHMLENCNQLDAARKFATERVNTAKASARVATTVEADTTNVRH